MKNNNNLVVLISCMNENDYSILERTKLESDAVVINQCNHNSEEIINFTDIHGNNHKVIYVCTTERGLSKSRNLALSYSKGYNYALICDDDENLTSGYEEIILNAYDTDPNIDVFAFAISCDQYSRKYDDFVKKLGFIEILKTSSQQISFKIDSILHNNISFDEKMGSGTGNGAGEETKFLLDCRNKGLNMYYHPFIVAKILKGESQWFNGYTEKYFINQGWTDRRLLGNVLGLAYIFYWTIFRHSEYSKDNISIWKALKCSLKGYFLKR